MEIDLKIPNARMREDDVVDRTKRQITLLIATLDLLLVYAGITSAGDIRQLRTPEGVAQRWLQAAVIGDCHDYLALSVADPAHPDARTDDELCADLRRQRQAAKEMSGTTVRLGPVEAERVHAYLLHNDDEPVVVIMNMTKRGGHWRVLRDDSTCGSGCY